MRHEDDLRSALRVLERETPSAEEVLRHVTERTGAAKGGRGRPPGRRVMAGVAAAAAVIAIALAAALLATPPRGHGRASPQDALRSVPRYYMALVPVNLKSYEKTGLIDEDYAVVRDRITGQTLATVRPPRPYITFVGVTGAADDRTFVLTAQSTITGSLTLRDKFFYARFNPAHSAVTLTPLALSGLPVSNSFAAAALSPDGTRLAVASQNGPAQIAVYSLPSGAAKTWSANGGSSQAFGPDIVNLLSWSRTGILAFGWNGSVESPGGVYLLNTNIRGGSLLADSRDAFCLMQPLPTATYGGISGTAYLTPDGTTIISPVPRPIPIGQRPPSCTSPSGGLPLTMPEFEEFSAATGRATSILYTSRSHGAEAGDVYWSNASGSVLVVQGKLRPGLKSPRVFGILSGSTFTPIPGSSSPPLIPQLAF
jgi:hypothetical protein